MTKSDSTPRVLMIGLDAAEVSLIDQWSRDGSLPNLRLLRDKGAFGALKSTADWLVGSPWPTFYTSTLPSNHGLYHYLLWKPDAMSTVRPAPDWLPLDPFWRQLGARGKRVVALDVPLTYAPPPFAGVEISGWATHELLVPPAYYPASIREWVTDHYGSPPRDEEDYRLMKPNELLNIRDHLIALTGSVADLSVGLMQKEAWDLMLVCFSATHRGGHKLWSLDGMAGEPSSDERARLQGALRDIYIACDQAIGRLLETAGDPLTVVVFSLHGMGENTCRSELLPEMLRPILADDVRPQTLSSPRRLAAKLRDAVPVRLRNAIKSRMPMAVQDRLTAYWRTGGIDWQTTPAFALASDLQGYIRINLRDREAAGVVASQAEYDRLCERISDGLKTYVDADTGQALVRDIARCSDLYPAGKHGPDLPDLVVRWNHTPAALHRSIRSERYGTIAWPTPGRHPSGRSGNHRPAGFVLACGDAFEPGDNIEGADILDLAPTVCELLGQPVPTSFRGRSLLAPRSTG